MQQFRTTFGAFVAILSLSGFVSSAVVLPLFHQAGHAEELACSDEAHGHCDHSEHAVAFEKPHHAHDSQPCVLCPRHISTTPIQDGLSHSDELSGPDLFANAAVLSNKIGRAAYPVRGPPAV